MQGVKHNGDVRPLDEVSQKTKVKDLFEQGQVVLHWVNDLHLQKKMTVRKLPNTLIKLFKMSRSMPHLKVSIIVGGQLRQVCVRDVCKLERGDILSEVIDCICNALRRRFAAAVIEFDTPVLLWASWVVACAHDECTCQDMHNF